MTDTTQPWEKDTKETPADTTEADAETPIVDTAESAGETQPTEDEPEELVIDEEISGMTVPQLRDALKEAGQVTTGRSAELKARLQEYRNTAEDSEEEEAAPATDSAGQQADLHLVNLVSQGMTVAEAREHIKNADEEKRATTTVNAAKKAKAEKAAKALKAVEDLQG